MNRRTFLSSAIAAALAPKELLADDGVALTSEAHPVFLGLDPAGGPDRGALVIGRYVHSTYGKTFVIDAATGFGLPPTDPTYIEMAERLRRALQHSMRLTQETLLEMVRETEEHLMRPESLEEMEVEVSALPSNKIRLRPRA